MIDAARELGYLMRRLHCGVQGVEVYATVLQCRQY